MGYSKTKREKHLRKTHRKLDEKRKKALIWFANKGMEITFGTDHVAVIGAAYEHFGRVLDRTGPITPTRLHAWYNVVFGFMGMHEPMKPDRPRSIKTLIEMVKNYGAEIETASAGYELIVRGADLLPQPLLNEIEAKRREIALTLTISTAAEHSESLHVPSKAETMAFYESYAWRKARYEVLKKHGAACQACGATRGNGVQMHIDHIRPLRKYWHLRLDLDNLQVLCGVCNHGKGNWDQTDWRPPT